jgi:hypothetical protein
MLGEARDTVSRPLREDDDFFRDDHEPACELISALIPGWADEVEEHGTSFGLLLLLLLKGVSLYSSGRFLLDRLIKLASKKADELTNVFEGGRRRF